MSKVGSNASIIVGGIPYTNGSVTLGLDVCLHVTNGSLDEGTSISVVNIVRDFVSSKETEDIGVVCHGVNDRGIVSIKLGIPLWVASVNG